MAIIQKEDKMSIAEVDMHAHTDWSDGADTPWELVRNAKSQGVKAICKTDHDVYAGESELLEAAGYYRLPVLLGIELSCFFKGFDIHILGYGLNTDKLSLMDSVLEKYWDLRQQRAKQILDNYRQSGLMQASLSDIRDKLKFNCPYVPMTRIIQYRALVGNISFTEASHELRRGSELRTGYDQDMILQPAEAVKLILQADGLPVLAHPGDFAQRNNGDKSSADNVFNEVLEILLAAGLRGLECYYPSHRPSQVVKFLSLACKHNLLVTGGSDYHGPLSHWDIHLGSAGVSYREFINLLKALHA